MNIINQGPRTIIGDIIVPMGQFATKGIIEYLKVKRTTDSLRDTRYDPFPIKLPRFGF